MKQVNSDKTVEVDAKLTRFVEDKVSSILARFAKKLTRVEVHLSDINNTKTRRPDKRCLIEARPSGDDPLSTSATAAKIESAIGEGLQKMKRSLTTFFGRKGRPAATVSGSVSTARKTLARKTTLGAKKKAAAKKRSAKRTTKLSPRGPKKKRVYQARRKSWPSR